MRARSGVAQRRMRCFTTAAGDLRAGFDPDGVPTMGPISHVHKAMTAIQRNVMPNLTASHPYQSE
jgi:hypothetical protein